MATTTPNFGWSVPTSSDLVKNGATAIETLGDSIDASLLDLKGGTTGQVLAKASGTDMDFTWTAIDPLVILDAKGDLITATAADTPARLAVGTNGQTLVADSTASTGLKWATPASGMTLISRQSFSNVATTTTTFDGVFTSTYKTYLLVVETAYAATATDDFLMQYRYSGTTQASGYYDCAMKATAGNNTWTSISSAPAVNFFTLTDACGASGTPSNGHLFIAMVGQGSSRVQHRGQFVTGNQPNFVFNGGYGDTARAYDGVIFSSTASNITGTVAIYGLAAA